VKVKRTTDREVWDAIFDAVRIEKGEDVARTEADDYAELVRRGRKYDRREWWVNFLQPVAWIVGITSILAAISFGIYSLAQGGSNDYAGFGPSKVQGHAVHVISNWYQRAFISREEAFFSGLKFQGQRRVIFEGHQAWKVNYLKPDGSKICAYVRASDNADTAEIGAVLQGSNC
jgi:hypothetical protein